MDQVTFKDVAELINLSPTTQIDLLPEQEKRAKESWTLYDARHTIQGQKYPYKVLYIKSDAREDDLKRALKEAGPSMATTDVVFAPSTGAQVSLQELFSKAGARSIQDTRAYFKLFLENDLDKYAAKLVERHPAPRDYVEPRIEAPAGPALRFDSVLEFLRTDEAGVGESEGRRLAVVLAEAGQGKTYHSEFLASRLLSDWRGQGRRLPIYIDATQWAELSKDDGPSIAQTIFHSFRFFGASLAWLEGREEQFLRTAFRLGLFTLIFDGLDEYVVWNGIPATRALESLVSLAAATTARMVVTARVSFWNSEILSLSNEIAETGVFTYTLQPFDRNNALNYFRKRLEGPGDADRALNVFLQLYDIDPGLAGRGFVLRLVADLFRNGSPSGAQRPQGGEDVMQWLMVALCDRERTRQSLPVSSEDQLAVFREIAAASLQGDKIDDGLVSLALQSISAAVDAQSAPAVLEKLSSHPLLRRISGTTRAWAFSHEHVCNLLVAQHLDGLLDRSESSSIGRFFASVNPQEGLALDLAELLVDVALAKDGGSGNRIRRFIAACSTVGEDLLHPRFVYALASNSVDRMLPKGPHLERTKLLASLFPGDHVARLSRVVLWGKVARFDFSGVTFDGCVLDDVTFAQCTFDAQTTFRNCKFGGGQDVNSHAFGEAQFVPHPMGDPAALQWIRNKQARASRRQYTSEDLREDIGSVLRKFIARGGAGLKAVTDTNLKMGPVQHSPHADVILHVIKHRVLDEHTISQVGIGWHVRASAEEAMRFFASNNNLTGPLLEVLGELQRKLHL